MAEKTWAGPLERWLLREPFVVLDGGLASELAARGHDLDDPLWSARLLLDDPAAIERVHLDYFRAGADVATTASYQASSAGLRARGLDDAEARSLLRSAAAIAARARDTFVAERGHDGLPPMIVGSLGSFGATRADGSEYTGEFGAISDAELVAFHRERIEVLADGVDLLAFETIPSLREAEAIVRALADAGGPPTAAWVSFTCADATTTGAGDAIERCAAAVAGSPRVAAIGVNCTAPALVEELLGRIATVTAHPLVAYPNAGEHYDGATRRFVGTRTDAETFAALARGWIAAGARLVGGCCRTDAAYIGALAGLRGQLAR